MTAQVGVVAKVAVTQGPTEADKCRGYSAMAQAVRVPAASEAKTHSWFARS